jgi:hypothetical protein
VTAPADCGTMRGMTEVYSEQAPAAPKDALGRLSGSARGWHTIQMAVLGFIGICGVLRTASSSVPAWVQWLAGFLAVAALVLAGTGIYLVGRVAYPLDAAEGTPAAVARATQRLRSGIRLTVLALILIVIAALSGWWPKTADAGTGPAAVTVSDRSGRTWCGQLVAGSQGVVSLDTSGGQVGVPIPSVADIQPAASCP